MPKSLFLIQIDLFPLIKVKSALQDIHWLLSHESQLSYKFWHSMKLNGLTGSSTYLFPKSLFLTHFNLLLLIKTKSDLQDRHWVLSHVSQLLYLYSHLIKLDSSEGSWIYVLSKSLFLTQFNLFPLIKVNSFWQDKQWVALHVSQLLYLCSHVM